MCLLNNIGIHGMNMAIYASILIAHNIFIDFFTPSSSSVSLFLLIFAYFSSFSLSKVLFNWPPCAYLCFVVALPRYITLWHPAMIIYLNPLDHSSLLQSGTIPQNTIVTGTSQEQQHHTKWFYNMLVFIFVFSSQFANLVNLYARK